MITQSISNMLYTRVVRDFRNYSIFFHVGLIGALWWPSLYLYSLSLGLTRGCASCDALLHIWSFIYHGTTYQKVREYVEHEFSPERDELTHKETNSHDRLNRLANAVSENSPHVSTDCPQSANFR